MAASRQDVRQEWDPGQDVVPYLRDHGVTERDIGLMLVANPARVLSGAALPAGASQAPQSLLAPAGSWSSGVTPAAGPPAAIT